MSDHVALDLLARSTPAELDKAADVAMVEAFASGGERSTHLLRLAALARVVADWERSAIRYAKEVGAPHYHIGPPRICVHEDHTRTLVRELSGLGCPAPTVTEPRPP